VNEAHPASGPTHDRPQPGDRVLLIPSGEEGTVEYYEWGWNSTHFPVSIGGISRICSISFVRIIKPRVRKLAAPTGAETRADTNKTTETEASDGTNHEEVA
jgi:hypothetical protein